MGCGHNSVIKLFPSKHRSQIKFPTQNKPQTNKSKPQALSASLHTNLECCFHEAHHSFSVCLRQSSVQVIIQELQLNFVFLAFLDMSLCRCQASLQEPWWYRVSGNAWANLCYHWKHIFHSLDNFRVLGQRYLQAVVGCWGTEESGGEDIMSGYLQKKRTPLWPVLTIASTQSCHAGVYITLVWINKSWGTHSFLSQRVPHYRHSVRVYAEGQAGTFFWWLLQCKNVTLFWNACSILQMQALF